MKKTIIALFSIISVAWAFAPTASGQEVRQTAKKVDITRLSSNYYIPMRFKGKTILVTGGARGIGKWTATRAAREGAQVVIMDWLKEDGQRVVDSLNSVGLSAMFVYGNIAKVEDCQKAIDETIARYGKLDYACLNAGVMDGVYSGTPFEFDKEQRRLMPAIITDATDEYWQNVMEVNAKGTFFSMRAVLRQMLKQGSGGAIVATGSIAGMTGLSGNPAYVSSKFALNGLVRNAAIDYAPYGIRVNSVNMAETQTPMVERAGEFVAAESKAGIGFGMGRVKTMSLLKYCDSQHRGSMPWEQASTILYLISDEASAITGTVMATDGGWTDF